MAPVTFLHEVDQEEKVLVVESDAHYEALNVEDIESSAELL